jgi:hypothetical protein
LGHGLAGQGHRDGLGALDHVGVGEDLAACAEHDPGACGDSLGAAGIDADHSGLELGDDAGHVKSWPGELLGAGSDAAGGRRGDGGEVVEGAGHQRAGGTCEHGHDDQRHCGAPAPCSAPGRRLGGSGRGLLPVVVPLRGRPLRERRLLALGCCCHAAHLLSGTLSMLAVRHGPA